MFSILFLILVLPMVWTSRRWCVDGVFVLNIVEEFSMKRSFIPRSLWWGFVFVFVFLNLKNPQPSVRDILFFNVQMPDLQNILLGVSAVAPWGGIFGTLGFQWRWLDSCRENICFEYINLEICSWSMVGGGSIYPVLSVGVKKLPLSTDRRWLAA